PVRHIGRRLAHFADATFGGDQHALAHSGDFFEKCAEHSLWHAIAINIGMIEKRVTRFVGRNYRLLSSGLTFWRHFRRIPTARDAPAAISQSAADQFAFTNLDSLHTAIHEFELA